MTCPLPSRFRELLASINQTVAIDEASQNPLRYNVWSTTPAVIKKMFKDLSTEGLPDKDASVHIENKLRNLFDSLRTTGIPSKFKEDILESEDSVHASIALHELMEAVKGEADKAKKLGIQVKEVTLDGVLPVVPMARIAASIGRKITFQEGVRFHSTKENKATPEEIEELYHTVGTAALTLLEGKGYAKIEEKGTTIKDYLDEKDAYKAYPETDVVVSGVTSVSLNMKALGIGKDVKEEARKPSTEVLYFLNRPKSELSKEGLDDSFKGIIDSLNAVSQITQPAEHRVPDQETNIDSYESLDAQGIKLAETTDKVRKQLYEKPLKVHGAVHGLMELLHEEVKKTGNPASKVLRDMFGNKPNVIRSLFGFKNSSLFSVDKRGSISGQNLSKTTALDDVAEYYDLLVKDGDRADLHMPLKVGRNMRLYYLNTVLNAHASKQSRYMVTAGEQSVKKGSEDYDYLVHQVGEMLDPSLTYNNIVSKGSSAKVDKALGMYQHYKSAEDLNSTVAALSHIANVFPGKDYVTLITTLQAIEDIRGADHTVKTEFTVSEDATASGGTLTFFQALGSNPNVQTFLESVGLLVKEDGSVDGSVSDIYQLMTSAMEKFLKGEDIGVIAEDIGVNHSEVKETLQDTLDLLFSEGEDIRELSKPAIMTFVYGQGKRGAIETISTHLADRLIDSLGDPKTKVYLSKLLKDSRYLELDLTDLNNQEGLYQRIKEKLTEGGDSNLPGQLYELLNVELKAKYLKQHEEMSNNIFALAKKVAGRGIIKMLPASAVLDGKTAEKDLAEYGMPIAKIFEVMSKTPSGTSVLTRRQILQKTVMDVSPIHGVDAALLYHAINDADPESGVVVVHDEVRGTVKDVRKIGKAYTKRAKEVLAAYDIHEQMLKALAVYDPSITENPEYKALLKGVTTSIGTKKELADRFNESTTALIGEGDKFKTFARGEKKLEKESKNPVRDFVKGLGKDSELIQKFLNVFDTKLEKGDAFRFTPNKDTITVNTDSKSSRKKTIEAMEHEIVHAATVSEIRKALTGQASTASTRDVRYFQKTVRQLSKFKGNLSEELKDRLLYIRSQPSEEQQIAEFVAVMQSEKDIAEEVYKTLSIKSFEGRIAAFIARVRMAIAELTDTDFAEEVDAGKLYGALQRVLDKGVRSRLDQRNEVQETLKTIEHTYGFGESTKRVDINYMNKAVSRLLMDKAEVTGKGILGKAHFLAGKYDLYNDVVNKIVGIYDSSEDFQQLITTITGEGANKKLKAKVLAKYAETMGQKNDLIQKGTAEFEELAKPLSKEERTTLDRSITGIPLHDYFVFSEELNTVKKIDAEVSRLEEKLGKDSNAVKDVNSLVDLNVRDKVTGDVYNLQGYATNNEYHENVRKLLALKSIQAVGTKAFVDLLGNKELTAKLKDFTVANHLSLTAVNGTDMLRAGGIPHSYDEGGEPRAIALEELSMYQQGEDTGWEVITEPTKDRLGLVHKKTIDSTTLPGVFTDVMLSSADVSVPASKRHYNNVITTPDGYRMITTAKQREAMGSLGAVQSLVRGTAHAMAIQESAIIRDTLLKKEVTFTLTTDNFSDLTDILEDPGKDNPWFLKGDGVKYENLSDKMKARYRPVGKRVSDVDGFNEKVDWVRKDISHWLLGNASISPFTSPKWQWALRVTKNLVAGAKIGMVVLNPAKIARDNISNVAYLGVMGVSPTFAFNSYKEITEQYGEYTKTKDKLLSAKVNVIANPDNAAIKKKEAALQKELGNNPISSIQGKGFLNSLGSTLVTRESGTLGGMQKDVDTALRFMLKDKKGKSNHIAHFLMQLQKIGPHGEDFLGYLGNVVGKYKAGKELDSELTKISDRLSKIRKDEDVVAYAAQFINAPQSEAVRFGANVTDLSDVLAKETYYRHLVEEEGMASEDAKIKVLDSFPNYTENLPMAVQQASDVGILMFPSFWLRIQKIIYRMAKDKPLSLATEEAIDAYLGTNLDTIVDANIYNKATSWSGILHSPGEAVGVGSVLPLNLL